MAASGPTGSGLDALELHLVGPRDSITAGQAGLPGCTPAADLIGERLAWLFLLQGGAPMAASTGAGGG